MRFSTLILTAFLGATAAMAAPGTSPAPASELTAAPKGRDPSFPACDAKAWHLTSVKTTDVEVKAIGGGTGSCNITYDTNKVRAACLGPGWIGSAENSKCGAWIEAQHNGKTVYAKVVDTCLGDEGSPFTCRDAWFTVKAFNLLADDDEVQQGHLDGPVQWKFI